MLKRKKSISSICILMAILIAFSGTFIFAGATDATNLARDKSVTVSSVLKITGCDYAKVNATDGDLDTSWYADPAKASAEISVDLGEAMELSLIKIFWGIYDYATEFYVYCTALENPTDADWVEIPQSKMRNTIYSAHYVTEIELAGSVRQIKISCKEKNDWSYEIFEIEAYAPIQETTTEPTTTAEPTIPVTQPTSPTTGTVEIFDVERKMNHTYLPVEWFEREYSDDYINGELDKLQANSIKYLFCDIGLYSVEENKNGVLAVKKYIDYTSLGHWIKLAHERNMIVSVCVNAGLYQEFYECAAGTTTTFATKIKNQVVALSKVMLNTGLVYDGVTYFADGMHLDFEPFGKEHQDYFLSVVTALNKVTTANGKMLSVYSPAKNGAWSAAYLKKIVALVDMICPALYDTNGPETWGTVNGDGVTQTAQEYMTVCKNTCLWYSTNILASNNPDCMLSPTVPVYEDKYGIDKNSKVGFPNANDAQKIYYHMNYNPYTGEELESLQNAVTAINEAVASLAKVYSAGVFYWPAFTGDSGAYKTSINPYYNPVDDMNDWQSIWVNG